MFFANGFRPFFFGAGVWAVASLLVWLWAYFGTLVLASSFDPLVWHQHEMIFGYATAVIAGFLLTAVPNWTGVTPVRGRPLTLLFALWVLGRIVCTVSIGLPGALVAVIDLSFLAVLLVFIGRAIVRAGNKRNLVVIGLISLLVLANALMHAEFIWGVETSRIGGRLGLGAVILLITLIGGRVVPNFTQNWMRKEGIDGTSIQFSTVDCLSIAFTVVTILAWVVNPDWAIVGVLFLISGIFGFLRLSEWGAHKTLQEPLVTILHIGFGWLPLGYLLMGGSIFLDRLPQSTALHGLTVGAIGTMTLAVMTRASLGHTGRALTADRATVAIFGLITLSAILRVGSALGPDPLTMTWLSGLAWIAAYLVFLGTYGPMFFRARAG